jgi:hypothetical protein
VTNGEEKRKGPDLVTVLAAVATAIGTLGWVAFIGGAILWISFNQANLPTAEAIARVPTGVLVATGAEFVVWAVLAALMTVVALYIFDEPLQRLITASHAGRSEPVLRGLLPATLVAGTAIAFAFLIDLGYGHVPWPWGVLAVCLAAVGAGVVGALLFMNTGARFAVIGLFALVAVPLVMAIATYYRAQAAPRVEPVALLRGDGTPFVGFFIAETSDRVYVGTFDELAPNPCDLLPQRERHGLCGGKVEEVTVPARLLSLPKNDVVNLTVGPRTPLYAEDALSDPSRPQTAREWAAGAALRLCDAADSARKNAVANLSAGPGASPQPTLPAICSDQDIQNLSQFQQREQDAVEAAASN